MTDAIAMKEQYPEVDPGLYDYISDGDDDELADDDAFDGVQLDESFANAIVVDNLPQVPVAKVTKLLQVLCKIFFKGQKRDEKITMPVGDDGVTLGFAFIDFDDAETARKKCKKCVGNKPATGTNGFRLDKAHVFKVTPYPAMQKYAATPDEYAAPELPRYKRQEDLLAFLGDAAVRDQYLERHGATTAITWIRSDGNDELDYDGANQRAAGRRTWCDDLTAWSPRGTYLATYHRQGLALWGGRSWAQVQKFPHANVHHAAVSPAERYIITWDGREVESNPKSCACWDLKSGRLLRPFAVWPGGVVERDGEASVMQWSSDDRYFARVSKQRTGIQVYETPKCGLVDNKPLRAVGVVDFSWSPGGNVLAYWAAETDNTPARVTIIDLATRKEVRSKQLVNVSDCQLTWQSAGDFLGVQVTRHSKSGKTKFTNFEIFRMRDKDIPIERLDMDDPVVAFAFEPRRERFAIIHGTQTVRFNVSFYTLGATEGGKKMEKMYTIEDQSANRIFWSPTGGAVVLAGFDNINGQLQFWNVDDKESFNEDEHFMCNNVAWDPSGRLVCTYVAQPMHGDGNARYQMENGYKIWSFQGVPLKQKKVEPFYQFLWRPRPPPLLTKAEQKDIQKNLRKHTARFESEDRVRHRRIRLRKDLGRFEKLKAYRVAAAARTARYEAECEERYQLGMWKDMRSPDMWDIEVIEMEDLINTKRAEMARKEKK